VYGMKKARVLRVEARQRPAASTVTDRSPWDWYALSCTCGLPPGACRAHPRARMSQRPPAGDRRVWGYVAGRGAGKTRAGACWIQRRVEAGIRPEADPAPCPRCGKHSRLLHVAALTLRPSSRRVKLCFYV